MGHELSKNLIHIPYILWAKTICLFAKHNWNRVRLTDGNGDNFIKATCFRCYKEDLKSSDG